MRRTGILAVVASALAAAQVSAMQCSQSESFLLYPQDGMLVDSFGAQVDVTENWIVSGASEWAQDGAVYLYSRGAFVQEHKLLPPNPGNAVNFGWAVSIDGDQVAVTEPFIAASTGRVHLYRFQNGVWNPLQIVDGEAGQGLGRSVSLDLQSGILAAGTYAEAVELYSFDGVAWNSLRRLIHLGGANEFGRSVSLSGNRLAVGAPGDAGNRGAVYVYQGSGLSWVLLDKLIQPDTDAGDKFGDAVALDGDDLVVGAPEFSIGGIKSGAAFRYSFDGAHFVEQQRLGAPVPVADDRNGYSVAIDGDVILVSAQGASGPGGFEGVVHQYRQQGLAWVAQQVLFRAVAGPSSGIGESVTVHDGTVIVGDRWANPLVVGSGGLFGFELEDLSLAASPPAPTLGQNLFIDACGGAPANPALLFLVGFGGVPLFLKLAKGQFDAEGGWSLVGPYSDPGLAGIVLDLQVYGLDAQHKIRASNVASIDFQ